MSWIGFTLALTAFVGTHYLPTRGSLRDRLVAATGRRVYLAAYGLVSLAVLAWVVVAAGSAPYVELWPQLPWMRWAPNVAMPAAAMLAAVGLGAGHAFTLGGRRTAVFDRTDPGLAAVTRHPLLWALALWAGGHLVVNGDLAHVLVFGAFMTMALAAMPVFDGRARRSLAPRDARAFFAATSLLSLGPFLDPGWRRANLRPLGRRCVIGLAVWLAALLVHPLVIGVSPLPF